MGDIERKGVCVLTADIKATKTKDGSYDIVLSMPQVDRDGEIIDAKAFEPLPVGRMPIDVDHGMTVLTTVGSGAPAYDGEILKLKDFRFASTPLGQEVRTLVDEGHISKMSVAFMDAEREVDEKDGLPHVRKAELLNAAIVAIPSLREADIVLLAKSALAKVGARNSSKDAETIQSIHDAASNLGATCGDVEKRTRTSDTKSVAGSFEERAESLRETIRGSYPDAEWVWIRATFDDSVIFEVTNEDGTSTTWRAAYSEEDGAFTIDTPEEVDLTEVVTPPQTPAATDPEEAAAKAAAVPPAEVLLAQAQASIANAELTLLP